MAIVADTYTYVVGVDTHAATHHYAIVETRSGGQIAHGKFPTSMPRACCGPWIGSSAAPVLTTTQLSTRC